MPGCRADSEARGPRGAALPALTSLRFFAAALIVFGHGASKAYFDYALPVFDVRQAVSFFFVLSGFILTHVYRHAHGWAAWRGFAAARFARIWPVHAVTALLAIATVAPPDGVHPVLLTSVNLLLGQAAVPLATWHYSLNAVAWSISAEAFFYIAFPFLLALACTRGARALLAPAALLATLPLAARIRLPLPSFVATFTGLFAIGRISDEFDQNTATLVVVFVFALYSLGANTRGRAAWVAVPLVLACIAAFVTDDGDSFRWGDVAFATMLVGGPWAAGLALRLRRQSERHLTLRTVELEREREEKARAAVAEERARIARELHDVVAHAISVVVLQARGGRRMLAQAPEESEEAFTTIERTAEQALAEMRRLLGLLREGDEDLLHAPQPSLARLEALATRVRASGLPVEVTVEGEPVELPPGVDVSAYRIVQEALTNALKHAGPARAHVLVRYGDGAVEVEVADDGRGNGVGGGSGHGLVGIRERVAVYGGDFAAGSGPDGGYAVRARLPYGDER